MLIIELLNFVLLIYVGISVLYLITFAVLGLFPHKIKKPVKHKQHKFVIFIPAYKEDNVIYNVAKEVLNQDYPTSLFDVIVIADSFQQKTLDNLKLLPITINKVSFENSTKAKALNKTMEAIPEELYDIALILDADNILKSDFIKKINDSFNAGYRIVQGHRTAKNTDGFAILDAISEGINNHILSKGQRVAGLSSRLVGSGMAFSYQLYKENMKSIDSIAEDKELELTLLKKGYEFEYRNDAICYDEKVSSVDVFNKQRSRWISAQFYYFKKDFLKAFKTLIVNGNKDYFNKAFQMVLPPRLILIGFLFFSTIASFFLSPKFYFFIWTGLFVIHIVSCAISIPRKFYNSNMVYAFIYLPKAFVGIITALFKSKEANKTFIHTPHTNIETKRKY